MLQIYFCPRSTVVCNVVGQYVEWARINFQLIQKSSVKAFLTLCSAVGGGSSKSCNKYRKQLCGGCREKHRIIWVDLLQYASTQCNLNTRQYSLQYRQTQTMHTTAKLKTVFWRRIAHVCDAGTRVLAQPGAHLSNDYNYAQKQLLTSSIFWLDRYCNPSSRVRP